MRNRKAIAGCVLALLVSICGRGYGAIEAAPTNQSVTYQSVSESFDWDLYYKAPDVDYQELLDFFRADQEELLPVMLPNPDPDCFTKRSPRKLLISRRTMPSSLIRQLVPASVGGVRVYPITVREDPVTHAILIYNLDNVLISSEPAEDNYNPFWYLESKYGHLFSSSTRSVTDSRNTPDLEWYRAVYSPAKVIGDYYLMYERDLIAATALRGMEEQQSAARAASAGGGTRSGGSVTNLKFSQMNCSTSGMTVTLAFPENSTNAIELYSFQDSSTNPFNGQDGVWARAASDLMPYGTNNTLVWQVPGYEDNSNFFFTAGWSIDTDGDSLKDPEEVLIWKTRSDLADTDDDGLGDGYELGWGYDPFNNDMDGDGLEDGEEVNDYGSNPEEQDTDSDGISDNLEVLVYHTNPNAQDSDGDTLDDYAEIHTHGTDPNDADSDNDGLTDAWELDNGLDPEDDDWDNDGLEDGEEIALRTDPKAQDTDEDDLSDYQEVKTYFSNPLSQDTDGDGLLDDDEIDEGCSVITADSDNDGLSDGEEVNEALTDPNDPHSDSDTLNDGEEFKIWGTDPNDSDSDNDGLSDSREVKYFHTDPNDSDSDNDDLSDYREVIKLKSDPIDPDDPISEEDIQGIMMNGGGGGSLPTPRAVYFGRPSYSSTNFYYSYDSFDVLHDKVRVGYGWLDGSGSSANFTPNLNRNPVQVYLTQPNRSSFPGVWVYAEEIGDPFTDIDMGRGWAGGNNCYADYTRDERPVYCTRPDANGCPNLWVYGHSYGDIFDYSQICYGWADSFGVVPDTNRNPSAIYYGQIDETGHPKKFVYSHDWTLDNDVDMGSGWAGGDTFIPSTNQNSSQVYYSRPDPSGNPNHYVYTYDDTDMGRGVSICQGWVVPGGFVPDRYYRPHIYCGLPKYGDCKKVIYAKSSSDLDHAVEVGQGWPTMIGFMADRRLGHYDVYYGRLAGTSDCYLFGKNDFDLLDRENTGDGWIMMNDILRPEDTGVDTDTNGVVDGYDWLFDLEETMGRIHKKPKNDMTSVPQVEEVKSTAPNDSRALKMHLSVDDNSGSESEMYKLKVGPITLTMTSPGVGKSITTPVLEGESFLNCYIESLPDDDPDGDYDVWVEGRGILITNMQVLGSHGDTGFNSGRKYFNVFVSRLNLDAYLPGNYSSPGAKASRYHEEDPVFMMAAVNSDNDSNRGPHHQDNDDTALSGNDDDIVRIVLDELSARHDGLRSGKLKLHSCPSNSAKIYQSANGLLGNHEVPLANPSSFNFLKPLADSSVGDTRILAIEGLEPCSDYSLRYVYEYNDCTWEDEVRIAFVETDITVDLDNDGTIEPDLEEDDSNLEEDFPGKIVLVNADDDNDNRIIDSKEEQIEREDDLEEVRMAYAPMNNVPGAYVKLWWGNTNIAVWEEQTKTDEIVMNDADNVWIVDDENAPYRVFVEGKNAGTTTLYFAYFNNVHRKVYEDRIVFTVIGPRLLPDFNHDRAITEEDYAHSITNGPFRFWINDDDDKSADEKTGDDSDIPGEGSPDANNNYVDGMRDLVDFFPVYVDLTNTLSLLGTANYDFSIHLEGDTSLVYPRLGLIFTDLTPRSAGCYLTNITVAASLDDESVELFGYNGNVVDLPESFLQDIRDDGKGIVLIEARSTTLGNRLVVEIKDGNNNSIGSMGFALNTDSVEKMFRHLNLVDDLDVSEMQTVTVPDRFIGSGSEPTNFPDRLCNDDNFVFVHGYNVSQSAARAWHSEIFKRLYQSGSRAKFTGVTWHGNTGANYHRAVINAMVTGRNLANELSFLTGEVTVGAHSLGNMLVSEAIANNGFSPDRYFMFNAAVPIEAYDQTQLIGQNSVNMEENMCHPQWADYTNRLFAANWYQLFPGDNRYQLTWNDRYSTIDSSVDVYNFYSEGEDVVQNADGTVPNFIELAVQLIKDKGRRAWALQEMVKGKDGPENQFLFNVVMPDQHAGWQFNPARDVFSYLSGIQPPSPATAALLTDEELRITPFFEKFIFAGHGLTGRFPGYDGEELFAPLGDTDANTQAAQDGTQYKLLAEAIPALSFAAAANEVDVFDPLFGPSRNIHLEDLNTGWPSIRSNDDWLHSDLKHIALPYISKLYDRVVSEGGLDAE